MKEETNSERLTGTQIGMTGKTPSTPTFSPSPRTTAAEIPSPKSVIY